MASYLNTPEEFQAAVSATNEGNPMLINFSSSMVRDSLKYDNIFLGQQQNYPNLTFKRVDIMMSPQAAQISQAAGVTAMPTFVLFKEGSANERLTGAFEESDLLDLIDRAGA